ncbi:MAG TPA: glycosyltransferase [Bacteroidales bacterium]|nr:glycosyltransferase [Bacteroidales bacterium]HRZ49572.1 glycosyltransferase [Bacteroidales bacterium]
MKKVLIITYYWPPAGGAGVQRWLKLSKYLPDSGWMPVIYTPEVAESPVDDPTLIADVREDTEVIRRPIWEPYHIYKWLTGKKKSERVNAGFLHEGKPPVLRERLSVWIRGNFLIPDPRCFWIRPSVRYLSGYLKDHPVDAIISTGPPHSMHMIAMKLKRKTGIPWVADFRDPWTKIDFYHRLQLTHWADTRHRKLERQVLGTADAVLTIGWNSAGDLRQLGAANPMVVPNGYDPADFSELPPFRYEKFTITHAGVMNDDRNPKLLWEALAEMVSQREEFRKDLVIRLIGKVDFTVKESLNKAGLTSNTEIIPYLTHHEAVREMAKSAVLLLSINQSPTAPGILTGKLFEYLAVGRPILCVSPVQGDSERVLSETRRGVCAGYPGGPSLKGLVEKLYSDFQDHLLAVPGEPPANYTRSGQAATVAGILDRL